MHAVSTNQSARYIETWWCGGLYKAVIEKANTQRVKYTFIYTKHGTSISYTLAIED